MFLRAKGREIFFSIISYCVYISNRYALILLAAVLPHKHWPLGIKFAVYFAITLAISSLSWTLIERPLNELKRHFRYSVATGR